MEQRPEAESEAGTAFWESALDLRPSLKYDNRPYLVAAFAGWAEARNRPFTGMVDVEEQAVPEGYAAGYRTPMA